MRNIISELQIIRQQQQQLAEEEARLLTPLITDISELETVYGIFKSLTQNQQPRSLAQSVAQRRKFIFIALCFFAPGTLAGNRFPHGFRATLAEVLGIYPSFISDNIENVIFQYQRMKAFREELEYLYSEIRNMLERLEKTDTFNWKSADFKPEKCRVPDGEIRSFL